MVSIGGISRFLFGSILRASLVLGFLGFLVFAHRYSTFRISKNFAEVVPGQFYRSAQLTDEELEKAIQDYRIKTVISLRGAPEHTEWYQEQTAVLAKHKVAFHALWWMAEFFPPKAELQKYIQLLDTVEYPILIHCRVGSDRTGLATAIYAMDKLRTPKEIAINQHLSFDYWHVPAFKPAMVEFAKIYRGPEWITSKYDECDPANFAFVEHPDCPPVSAVVSDNQ